MLDASAQGRGAGRVAGVDAGWVPGRFTGGKTASAGEEVVRGSARGGWVGAEYRGRGCSALPCSWCCFPALVMCANLPTFRLFDMLAFRLVGLLESWRVVVVLQGERSQEECRQGGADTECWCERGGRGKYRWVGLPAGVRRKERGRESRRASTRWRGVAG